MPGDKEPNEAARWTSVVQWAPNVKDVEPKVRYAPSGVFLILAAKAPASVWKVHRSARGVITRLEKKREHVCHDSFHIMDPVFGLLVIKMSGHPPFGLQVILNGHEYVAVAAQGEGSGSPRRGTVY